MPIPSKVLLVSTYELGHSPSGVATAAAALRDRGHAVRVLDLAIDDWDAGAAAWADRVAISVPMHTAARLVRGQRRRTIRIPETWPWAGELEAAFRAAFALTPT